MTSRNSKPTNKSTSRQLNDYGSHRPYWIGRHIYDTGWKSHRYTLHEEGGCEGKEVLVEGEYGWKEYWALESHLKSAREVMKDGRNGGGTVGYTD